MNKMSFATIKRLSLFFAVLMLAASCRKGDLPEAHYFGKVNIDLLNLPNTPTVMMFFDGQPLDTIKAIVGSSFTISSGKTAKLAAFDAKSKEWLADTLITIAPNGMQQFRFAYSTELGIRGFISGGSSSTVPADSFDVRLFNNLDAAFYPKQEYDLQFIYADPATGNIDTATTILKDWRRKQLSTVLRFKGVTGDGLQYTYAAILRDPASGAVVLQPDGSEFFIITGEILGGKSTITTVTNDNNGTIIPDVIEL